MTRPWCWPAFAFFFLLAGCSSGHFSEKSSAGKGNTFRYPLVVNPTHIDPALVQDVETSDVTLQVFEGLVAFGEDNKVVPNLAENWDIQDGGKTYVFHLRKGVTFSDGTVLKAADFKASIERACEPALHSTTAIEYLSDIVGVADACAGKATSVKGITAVDDSTLKIEIDRPRPYFLGKLVYPCAYVVSTKAVRPHKEMGGPTEMVGSGPFLVKRYVEDQVLELGANKTYHGGSPLIDGIERPILKDASTRLSKYKSGEIDLVNLERRDVLAARSDPQLAPALRDFKRPAVWYIAFNTKAYPPFATPAVRQAFCNAVDTKSMVEKTLGGLDAEATGILPPGVLGARDGAHRIGYYPATAKALLTSAGFSDGSKLPALELYYRAGSDDARLIAEATQADLRKNLGVDVALRPLEWSTFLEKNDRKELPMYVLSWFADYADPQDFLSTLLATAGSDNRSNFSDPEVDRLCAEGDAMMPADNPARLRKYQDAEDRCLQLGAWLPIFFHVDHELISPRVQGLRNSVFYHLPHSKLKLSP